jgi:hypothetical protein
MARTLIKRSRALALVAVGAMTLSGVTASGAAAAPAEETCTITGFTPKQFVVGTKWTQRKFKIQTTGCTVKNWRIDVESWSHPLLAKQSLPFTTFVADEMVNADARSYEVVVKARSTDDKVSKKKFRFSLVRRSTFGTSLSVGSGPATRGDTLEVLGSLKRVNWGADPAYAPYPGRAVEVQFRAVGTKKFVKVKDATTDAEGNVATTVTANKSGFWRLHFAGNAATGAADSNVDGVRVSRPDN